jgi:hypothetical protein
MMDNKFSTMSYEILDLFNNGKSYNEIINEISERWEEKTFVVTRIVELVLSENQNK